MKQIRFQCDADGKLVVENGEYGDEKFLTTVKFPKSSRFALGVACVKKNDEAENVGVMLEPFIYSGKFVYTIKEFEKVKREEIHRVKQLKPKCKSSNWLTGHRDIKDGLFMDDSIDKLCGISKSVILACEGIHTVRDLSEISDARRTEILHNPKIRMSHLKFDGLRAAAQEAKEGAFTRKIIDHTKADNPYQSLYGNDKWEAEILKAHVFQSRCVSVKQLVTHIIQSSQKAFNGTIHEKDWRFYHDALKQMTDSKCLNWMKETKDTHGVTYFDRWILPCKGLNAGTVYEKHPPGNSPELMPLDCHLNKDVKDCVARHYVVSNLLKRYVPNSTPTEAVFNVSTPKQYDSVMQRIYGPNKGALSSKRILEDICKCMSKHLLAIIKAKGCLVHGLGNKRNGDRYEKVGGHGGYREKNKKSDEHWFHSAIAEPKEAYFDLKKPIRI
eukprot:g451.t1